MTRLLPVLLLPCLLAASETGAPSEACLRHSEFDEREVERYRVDIQPCTPKSGIESGFVVAYGYYIAPPYEVVARAGTTFVNGVPVSPPLALRPFELDSAQAAMLMASEATRVEKYLSRVGAVMFDSLCRALASGLDKREALLAVQPLVDGDSVVDSVSIGSHMMMVFGPRVTFGDKEWTSHYSFWFPSSGADHSGPSSTPPKGIAVDQYRRILAGGQGIFFTQVERSLPEAPDCVAEVAKAMVTDGLSREERWSRIESTSSSTMANACIANRLSALAAWELAAARFGRE